MSHRRQIKPAYVWGALSNTEPPDDDEDVVGYYGSEHLLNPLPDADVEWWEEYAAIAAAEGKP